MFKRTFQCHPHEWSLTLVRIVKWPYATVSLVFVGDIMGSVVYGPRKALVRTKFVHMGIRMNPWVRSSDYH